MKLEREKILNMINSNSLNLYQSLSKNQVVVIKSQNELNKFIRKNLKNNEIIIGMGAGSISKWMKELKNII